MYKRPPPFCTQAKSGRDNGEMKPIQEHTCEPEKKKTIWKRNSLNRLVVSWCSGSQPRFTWSLGQGRMERKKKQSSKLHNKCMNILCSFRTSNKAISNNYLCMILLKQLKLIQNLYRNYKTGVLQSFYSMTRSTTGLWTKAHFCFDGKFA